MLLSLSRAGAPVLATTASLDSCDTRVGTPPFCFPGVSSPLRTKHVAGWGSSSVWAHAGVFKRGTAWGGRAINFTWDRLNGPLTDLTTPCNKNSIVGHKNTLTHPQRPLSRVGLNIIVWVLGGTAAVQVYIGRGWLAPGTPDLTGTPGTSI